MRKERKKSCLEFFIFCLTYIHIYCQEKQKKNFDFLKRTFLAKIFLKNNFIFKIIILLQMIAEKKLTFLEIIFGNLLKNI